MENFSRDVLLKKKWKEGSLEDLHVVIISRGFPDDRRTISGIEIEHVGRSYFNLRNGVSIPYHRIVDIYEGENLIWSLKQVSDSTT